MNNNSVDLTDYMDNDILHIVKGVLDTKYRKRSSVLSRNQIKIIVVSEVTTEIYNYPDKYKTFSSVLKLASDKVLLYSVSLNGVGLDKLVESIKSRLAVLDTAKAVGAKEGSEFND